REAGRAHHRSRSRCRRRAAACQERPRAHHLHSQRHTTGGRHRHRGAPRIRQRRPACAGHRHRPAGRGGPMLTFWTEATPAARRALIAASMGWALDAFDIMLFALVLPELRVDFGMSATTAGILASLTLVASAFGGVAFGVIADRFGRTRALILSVLMYSVFTAACGLATSVWHLAIFRVLLGIGMGGEWAS